MATASSLLSRFRIIGLPASRRFSARAFSIRPVPVSVVRPLTHISWGLRFDCDGASVRCFSTRSTTSSIQDPSPNWSNRPPKETILLDGCDFEHWLVVVEKPDEKLTRDEIIDSYIKTLAQVVGSEEEARMKIYSVSTKHYFAFGALVSEELSYKIKALPGVRWVLPDSYLDVKNKDYGGEPFIDGQAVPYDPKYHEEWVRNNARANERSRRQDRPRNYDRSRNFERRRENMQNRDFQNREAPPMPNFQNVASPPQPGQSAMPQNSFQQTPNQSTGPNQIPNAQPGYGYQAGPPGSPGYQAGPPGSPGYQAGPPGSPGYQAGPPSSPGYQAGPPGSSGYQAGPPGGPGYQAGPPGGPGYQAGPPGGPGYQSGPPGGPGYQAGPPGGPGYQAGLPGGPGYQAGPPGGPGYQSGPPGGPGYQSGPPGGPGYQAGPPGGPGYQAGPPGGPGYQAGLPGGPGYHAGLPGGPGYQDSQRGGPGYPAGPPSGPRYPAGPPSGQGYQASPPGGQGYQARPPGGQPFQAGQGYQSGLPRGPGYPVGQPGSSGSNHGGNQASQGGGPVGGLVSSESFGSSTYLNGSPADQGNVAYGPGGNNAGFQDGQPGAPASEGGNSTNLVRDIPGRDFE